METNRTPDYDTSDNPTGCCPRFNPLGWDGAELHFRDKPFLRATTHSIAHVPIDMGRVFTRVQRAIDSAGARMDGQTLVLSHELSAFADEHLFACDRPVPGEDRVTLSGDYLTRVFEGPYAEAQHWHGEMQDLARQKGYAPGKVYFFYTTCPKCQKVYGKNPVVGVVELLSG